MQSLSRTRIGSQLAQRTGALLKAQRDLSDALSATSVMEEAFELALDTALRISEMDCGGIYLADPCGGLHLAWHMGLSHERVRQAIYLPPASEEVSRLRAGRPLYGLGAGAMEHEDTLRASAFFPILHKGELIAALQVASYLVTELPLYVRRPLESLASTIGETIARIKHETTSQENRESFQSLFDSVEDFLFVLGIDGRIKRVNPSALRRLGYEEQALRDHHMTDLFPPERRSEAMEALLQVSTGQSGLCNLPLVSREGEEIPVETKLTQGRWRGTPVLFGISRDVAERERLQALKKVDDLKDRFLSILSHELRTPLNVITGFASMLEDEKMVEPQHHYVSKILAAAENLQGLIDDLLDLTRVQAGRFIIEPQPVELSSLLKEVLEDLAPLTEGRSLRAELPEGTTLPVIQADERRIRQVFMNLIGNAIKFSPATSSIFVSARLDGESLRFEVRDEGPGIAPEDLPHLFNRFVRFDTHKEGLGLGLSISKAIVEAHGGEIGVESQLETGSTFWFKLPRA
ncbi:MAG: ATP-binding protein [Bacteroidota bacterium]